MGVGRALAQPVGASVVAGQAQVSTAGAATLINQSTNTAIINWQDFSVGVGASVQFNQPNAASITLNRVTGANISNIEGAVRANGQVWLLNPNGVLFGNNARINVGGLLATTSDIANNNFLEGRYDFTGGKNSIINKGSITASSGGSVVLSAPTVTNSGLIQASAGHVVLGGTDTFTVDFNGDHLLSYAVGANSTGGKVTNTGKISAPGGQILLTARAAAGVQDAVINNTGMVEATSVREENGEIILEADGGGVSNSGTLDASGKGAGETGGTVNVLGKNIAITDGAKVDVSGDAGGGTVLVGGNFQGKGSEQHAQTVTVDKATIKADAISRGNGGKVAVWSDGTTKFAGAISARGGAASGHGGQVETSGHYLGVAANATVDTSAAMGFAGNWLLDPDNIDINSSGGCTTLGGSGCTDTTFGTTGDIVIAPSAIVAALGSGNVTLQANSDITVTSAVSAASSNTLYLEAGRSIILSAGLQNTGGTVALYAGNPNATGGTQSGATISGSGVLSASLIQLSLGATGSIGDSGSPIMISDAQTGQLALGVQALGADAYIATAAGIAATQVLIYNTGTVAAPGIGNHQGVNLTSATAGTIAGSGTIGSFTLTSSKPVHQAWGITATDLAISTTGSADIALDDIGNPPFGDIGNQIIGIAGFTTTGANVSYGNTLSLGTTLGSTSIVGDFTVTAAAFGPPFSPTPTTTYQPLTILSALTVSGNTTLSADSIGQTASISTNDLTASAQSGIDLQNTSNKVQGVARFTSTLDTNFTTGNAILTSLVLGNTSVGGNLTVIAPNLILQLADPNGGSVGVTGSAILSAKAITQNTSFNIPISANYLTATATGTGASSGIDLTDPAGGSSPRNAVSFADFFVAQGKKVSFYNNTDLSLGAVNGGEDVETNPIPVGDVDIRLTNQHQIILDDETMDEFGIVSSGTVNLAAASSMTTAASSQPLR